MRSLSDFSVQLILTKASCLACSNDQVLVLRQCCWPSIVVVRRSKSFSGVFGSLRESAGCNPAISEDWTPVSS